MLIEPSDFLEKYTDHLLSRRIINVLNWIDIYTIGDFVRYFWEWHDIKIQSQRWIWNDSAEKLRNFIVFLKSKWFIFSENPPEENLDITNSNYPNISENFIWMKLIAFPSILSKRTINALSNAWIILVSDIFDKLWRISAMMIDGLWKKGYSEIDQLIRYLKDQSLPMRHQSEDIDLKTIIEDHRLINVLNYNLITKVSHLWPYVTGVHDWGDLRYIKDEDIVLLINIHKKHNFATVERKQTIADTFLSNFSDIDKIIIQERILGEMNLEQLWVKLWLTRERVRQKQKDIEARIAEIWKSIIENDERLENNIKSIISNYWFILLPKHSYLFDFLWFSEQDFPLLFLMLSSLKDLRWDYLEKYRLYAVFSSTINLSGDTLRDIYYFLMKRLEKNNEDLSIDDLAYEYLLEDDTIKINQVKENKNTKLPRREKKIKYENTKWSVYELILES